jgi:hypothetical protein
MESALARVESYEQAEAYLLGRINYERWTPTNWTSAELKLEPMRELLARGVGDR